MNEIIINKAYFFPIIFIGAWFLVSLLMSIISGWFFLKTKYKQNIEFDGARWYLQSCGVGLGGCAYCATLGANKQYLFISMLLPFRLFHPNLLIPLGEIVGKERSIFVLGGVKLILKNIWYPNIYISKRLANNLERQTNGNWSYEHRS